MYPMRKRKQVSLVECTFFDYNKYHLSGREAKETCYKVAKLPEGESRWDEF
jgi:hypothetical protein